MHPGDKNAGTKAFAKVPKVRKGSKFNEVRKFINIRHVETNRY